MICPSTCGLVQKHAYESQLGALTDIYALRRGQVALERASGDGLSQIEITEKIEERAENDKHSHENYLMTSGCAS